MIRTKRSPMQPMCVRNVVALHIRRKSFVSPLRISKDWIDESDDSCCRIRDKVKTLNRR